MVSWSVQPVGICRVNSMAVATGGGYIGIYTLPQS